MINFDVFGKFCEKKADLQEVREGLVKSGTCNRLDRCRCSPSLVVTVIRFAHLVSRPHLAGARLGVKKWNGWQVGGDSCGRFSTVVPVTNLFLTFSVGCFS